MDVVYWLARNLILGGMIGDGLDIEGCLYWAYCGSWLMIWLGNDDLYTSTLKEEVLEEDLFWKMPAIYDSIPAV